MYINTTVNEKLMVVIITRSSCCNLSPRMPHNSWFPPSVLGPEYKGTVCLRATGVPTQSNDERAEKRHRLKPAQSILVSHVCRCAGMMQS